MNPLSGRRALSTSILLPGLATVIGALAVFLAQAQASSRQEVDRRFDERATIASRFVATYVSDPVTRRRAARAPLGSYLRDALPEAGSAVYLVDATGSVIAMSGKRSARAAAPNRLDRDLARALRRGGAGSYGSRRGRRRLAVAPVAGTPWRVVMAAPELALYDSIDGAGRWLPWLALAGFGLVGLIVVLLVRRLLASGERLAAMNAALDHVARIDSLTGLHNRRHMEEALAAAVSGARRHGLTLCVLMVDIDRFKSINDTHGHNAGDAVLSQTGETIRSSLRLEDTLARWGGEEFLSLMPSTDAAGARALAERLRATVAATRCRISNETAIEVTVTVGVAVWGGDEVADLVGRADAALYTGKEAGRNRVVMAPDLEHSEAIL